MLVGRRYIRLSSLPKINSINYSQFSALRGQARKKHQLRMHLPEKKLFQLISSSSSFSVSSSAPSFGSGVSAPLPDPLFTSFSFSAPERVKREIRTIEWELILNLAGEENVRWYNIVCFYAQRADRVWTVNPKNYHFHRSQLLFSWRYPGLVMREWNFVWARLTDCSRRLNCWQDIGESDAQ